MINRDLLKDEYLTGEEALSRAGEFAYAGSGKVSASRLQNLYFIAANAGYAKAYLELAGLIEMEYPSVENKTKVAALKLLYANATRSDRLCHEFDELDCARLASRFLTERHLEEIRKQAGLSPQVPNPK